MEVPEGTKALRRAEFKVIAKAAPHHSSDTYVCFYIERLSLNTYVRFQCSTQSELGVLLVKGGISILSWQVIKTLPMGTRSSRLAPFIHVAGSPT